MTTTISYLRENLSDTLNTVQYNHERIVLQRNHKDIAVIVPIEDYKILEELEDRYDLEEAEKILKNSTEDDFISFDEVKKELGL